MVMHTFRFGMLVLALVLPFLVPELAAGRSAEDVFPTDIDPFMGNWKGRWSENEDVDPDIAAQVIPRSRGRYEIRLVSKLFMRCPPLAIIEAEPDGGTLAFDDADYRGEIKGDSFTGSDRRGRKTFTMKRYIHECPTMGAPPPEGAVALFDGSGFDPWETAEGWELLEGGAAMVTPAGEYLVSKDRFKDVKLHLEFRLPYMPGSGGQQRGNSGVFLQDTYEVQILDSFGLEGYYNECGALYKVSAPKVNACFPPLEWQTFDITYRAPRHDANGELTEHPRMTVYHNGILIQKDQEMPWITGWKEKDRLEPAPTEPGPVKLQGHNNYLQFRNIWLVEGSGLVSCVFENARAQVFYLA